MGREEKKTVESFIHTHTTNVWRLGQRFSHRGGASFIAEPHHRVYSITQRNRTRETLINNTFRLKRMIHTAPAPPPQQIPDAYTIYMKKMEMLLFVYKQTNEQTLMWSQNAIQASPSLSRFHARSPHTARRRIYLFSNFRFEFPVRPKTMALSSCRDTLNESIHQRQKEKPKIRMKRNLSWEWQRDVQVSCVWPMSIDRGLEDWVNHYYYYYCSEWSGRWSTNINFTLCALVKS